MSQSALVNYAASELAPSAVDLGIAIGKSLGAAALSKATTYATKERPAKRGRSAYRKSTSRNMGHVGERVGSSSAKWDTLSVGYTNMTPQVINQLPLLNIIKSTANGAYDRRLHDQLNFRGIKFCMNFRCEGALGTAKAFMNVAVISPKSDISSADIIPNASFFRDPSGTRRDIPFGDVSLTSLDYYCTTINTDKYRIHKRMKMEIGPSASTEGHKEKYIEWYMPIVRQIRYNDNNQTPEGKNMYLVWWFSSSDGGTPANSVRYSYRVTRYFKETVGL